jgi:hypothetical protein
MQNQSIPKIDGGMIGNGRRHLHQDAIAHLNFVWPHLRKAYFFEVVEVQVLAAFPPVIKASEVGQLHPTFQLEPVAQ